jgi:hypothetical protein
MFEKNPIVLFALLVFCQAPYQASTVNYAPPECPDQAAHIVNVAPRSGWTAMNAWAVAVYNAGITSSNGAVVNVDYLEIGYGLNGVEHTVLKDDYDTWSDYWGGLFYRNPWCYNNVKTPMINVTASNSILSFDVSEDKTKVWHFWSSYRPFIPATYDYIYTKMRVKTSGAAVIQLGGDWYMSPTCVPKWDSTNIAIATTDWYGDPAGTNGWKILYTKSKP